MYHILFGNGQSNGQVDVYQKLTNILKQVNGKIQLGDKRK